MAKEFKDNSVKVVTGFSAKNERASLHAGLCFTMKSKAGKTVPHDTLEPKEIIERYTKGCQVDGLLNVKDNPTFDTEGLGFQSLADQEVIMNQPVPNVGMDLSEIEELTKGVKAKKEAFQKAVADAAAANV